MSAVLFHVFPALEHYFDLTVLYYFKCHTVKVLHFYQGIQSS